MHEGSCHCGAVRLTLPSTPTVATGCNCSLCRRIGGPWVYFEFGTVKIDGHPQATGEYIWGDKTLRTVHCKSCGCVTHWEPLEPTPGAKHGVNLGNFDPELIASVRVRRFDGAVRGGSSTSNAISLCQSQNAAQCLPSSGRSRLTRPAAHVKPSVPVESVEPLGESRSVQSCVGRGCDAGDGARCSRPCPGHRTDRAGTVRPLRGVYRRAAAAQN